VTTTSIAVYLVLFGFTLILVGCALTIVAWKLRRQLRDRRDAPVRERLAGLPSAVALDPVPPPAPRRGRARRVARDLVVEATGPLTGESRSRSIRWFEDNGYVDEAVRILRLPTNRAWRRAEAAALLGRMGSATAAPALARGLEDARYRVRDACSTALGRVATAREVPALIRAVERRRIPRGLLSGALLNLEPGADPALIACLRHPDPEARDLVARVLGMRRSAVAVPALVATLADPVPDVRRNAILAIAEIAGNTSVAVDPEPLIRLAVDDDAIVRAAAATGLGQILGDRAGRVLTGMTRDPDYWVSYRAAESLCRLPSGDDLGWRILVSRDATPSGRRATAACLEWLERTGGIERRMAAILARGDDDALVDALRVLGSVGSVAWADLLVTPAATGVGAAA
jgi:HEAT repeat protein